MKWFESVLHNLVISESHFRTFSGVIVACCLHSFKKSHNFDVTESMKIDILQAMSLTVSDGENQLKYMQNFLKDPVAKSVHVIVTEI